jgi:protein TonB
MRIPSWIKSTAIRAALIGVAVWTAWFVRDRILTSQRQLAELPQRVILLDQPEPEEEEPPPEEIDAPEPETVIQEAAPDAPEDIAPALDDSLGLDAEAVAGGDSFGLVAKRGARELLATIDDDARRGQEFAFFASTLRQHIQDELEQVTDLRTSNYTAEIAIWIGDGGSIPRAEVRRSSGDANLDRRLREALVSLRAMAIEPPRQMPQPVRLRISSRGARG